MKGLLRPEMSATAHHRNIQSLAIELLEIKQNQHLTMTDQLFEIFQTQSLSYPEK